MHEMLENWSLPWQTLQRSLAEAFRAEAELTSRSAVKTPTSSRSGSAASWLVRARSGALQVHRAGQ